MQGSTKKTKTFPKKPFIHKNTTIIIVRKLPIISQLAICKAYPHIVENEWITIGSIIDICFAMLKQRIDPALYNEAWTYTGSRVLEILLGETFDDGIKDIDILITESDLYSYKNHKNSGYPRIKQPKFYIDGFSKRFNGGIYGYKLIKREDPTVVADFITYKSFYGCIYLVRSFDLKCCQICLSKEMIYIKSPSSIIKKEFICKIWNYEEDTFSTHNEPMKQMNKRLTKYTKRGFKIHVKHKYCNFDQFYKDELSDSRNVSDTAWVTRQRDRFDKWTTNRPEEGLYKIKN